MGTGFAEAGVATDDSVAPDSSEVLPMLPASPERAMERVAICCCGVTIGREGNVRAGCGVDMHRVGGMGRWCGRRSFGER